MAVVDNDTKNSGEFTFSTFGSSMWENVVHRYESFKQVRHLWRLHRQNKKVFCEGVSVEWKPPYVDPVGHGSWDLLFLIHPTTLDLQYVLVFRLEAEKAKAKLLIRPPHHNQCNDPTVRQ